jgi:phosphoglycolate phosphatase-like HAD superfamily hydrolase
LTAGQALALDFDAVLGDTRPLWRAWLEELARRARVDVELPEDRAAAAGVLDGVVGNWRVLLERFAEEHAPLYLRPSAEVNAALRRLSADGVRLGAFTDAPEPLARVAAAQLGVARRLEAGPDAEERLLERFGPEARIVRSVAELAG